MRETNTQQVDFFKKAQIPYQFIALNSTHAADIFNLLCEHMNHNTYEKNTKHLITGGYVRKEGTSVFLQLPSSAAESMILKGRILKAIKKSTLMNKISLITVLQQPRLMIVNNAALTTCPAPPKC